MYTKAQLRAITKQHMHAEGRDWLMERLDDALTAVEELEKRDSGKRKALKAAKRAFEFSHGYSIKGETTKIGKAYKLVVAALKN